MRIVLHCWNGISGLYVWILNDNRGNCFPGHIVWEPVWHSYPVQHTGAIGCVGTVDPRGTDVTPRLQERPPRRSVWGEAWHLLSFRLCSHCQNIFQLFAFCDFLIISVQTIGFQIHPYMRPPLQTAHGGQRSNVSVTQTKPWWLGSSCTVTHCCFKPKRKLLPKHHLF